jgi:cobalt/nickel transport system permease protein
MHIPDGFLNTTTAVGTGVLAAAGLGVALRQTRLQLPPRQVPLLGLAAAFVFAAQMINFPVAGGTSGHLIGAVLVAALLGPSAAVTVLSAVLILQCLMFADGGLSALGANIFNMAILGGVGGWLVYRAVTRCVAGAFGQVLGVAFAGWVSTVLAAVACAGELALSGTVRAAVVLPAMAGVHMLIGLGEGLITALVLVGIMRARPELLAPAPNAVPESRPGALLVYGGLIALGLALFATPFASDAPDGLERTLAGLGLLPHHSEPALPAPLPDYRMPGIQGSVLTTSIAGGIGTLLAFALAWFLARILVPRSEPCAPATRRHAD